jgi:hypothetical protein
VPLRDHLGICRLWKHSRRSAKAVASSKKQREICRVKRTMRLTKSKSYKRS